MLPVVYRPDIKKNYEIDKVMENRKADKDKAVLDYPAHLESAFYTHNWFEN
jgi:hypothetical protein